MDKKQTTVKRKKCRACGSLFVPISTFQQVCSTPRCAIDFINTKQGQDKVRKNRRQGNREEKERLKTKSQLAKEAQAAFNAYIRHRDRNLPCISCGRYHDGQWHAGHYRTVAAAPQLRFDEDNCHKQCAPCNNHLSGNLVQYRPALIAKIGLTRVLRLEQSQGLAKYTREQLREIKLKYKQKVRGKND